MKSAAKVYRISVVAILSSLAAGCVSAPPASEQPPEPPPVRITHRDLCDSLKELFDDQLGAIDVASQPTTREATLDDPISINSWCEVVSGAAKEFSGLVRVRYAPSDPNPIGVLKHKYVETVVDGESVWVFDKRKDPKYAMSSVEIATTIGGWFGMFRIDPATTRTAEGQSSFTEADQEVASRFLIDTLRKTDESQMK